MQDAFPLESRGMIKVCFDQLKLMGAAFSYLSNIRLTRISELNRLILR